MTTTKTLPLKSSQKHETTNPSQNETKHLQTYSDVENRNLTKTSLARSMHL